MRSDAGWGRITQTQCRPAQLRIVELCDEVMDTNQLWWTLNKERGRGREMDAGYSTLYVLSLTHFPQPSEVYNRLFLLCGLLSDTLSIPLFAFPPPPRSKRGSIHSSLWPNQVWIELTAVCQSFLALRLQICNLCCCLLGIFNSNINTGIVSCKYIKCHCRPDSRYWLRPPSLDGHILRQNHMHFCIFVFTAEMEIRRQWRNGSSENIFF